MGERERERTRKITKGIQNSPQEGGIFLQILVAGEVHPSIRISTCVQMRGQENDLAPYTAPATKATPDLNKD